MLASIAAVVVAAVPGPAAGAPTLEADPEPCRSRACIERVKRKIITRQRRAVVAPYRAWINSTSTCESSGDWTVVSADGQYYGGMQFSLSSWGAVGGVGLPSEAPRLEQEYRAVRLLRVQGRGAWPVCG